MNVFLVDGTYELYRHFYAVPSATDVDGREVGAIRAWSARCCQCSRTA